MFRGSKSHSVSEFSGKKVAGDQQQVAANPSCKVTSHKLSLVQRRTSEASDVNEEPLEAASFERFVTMMVLEVLNLKLVDSAAKSSHSAIPAALRAGRKKSCRRGEDRFVRE